MSKKASVADLRNRFAQVSKWIEAGESVDIVKRGKSFARLTPISSRKRKALSWPNFIERLETNGLKTKGKESPASKLLLESRGNR